LQRPLRGDGDRDDPDADRVRPLPAAPGVRSHRRRAQGVGEERQARARPSIPVLANGTIRVTMQNAGDVIRRPRRSDRLGQYATRNRHTMNHQSAPAPDYRNDDRSTWGRGYGRLTGKNALVTGSTRGLGCTMIEWLAREGANIVVSGREQADVDASMAAMRDLGVTAWGFPADLSRIEDAHRLGEQAVEAVGQLDILVNNAGMSISNDFWKVSDDEFEYQFNVNCRSPFILAQHAARNMIEHGKGGRIVNISTVGVTAAHTERNVYNLSK